MENEPKHSPGYHSKRWYKRHLAAKRPAATVVPALTAAPGEQIGTGSVLSIISLVVTILIALLQWNGVVTVGWIFSLALYSPLLVWILWTVSHWEQLHHWNPLSRLAAIAVTMLVAIGISTLGLTTQYRRDHSNLTRSVESTPIIAPAKKADKEIIEQHETTTAVVAQKHLPMKIAKKVTPASPTASNCGKDVTIGVLGGSFHDNGAVVRNYLPCANIQMKGIEASSNRDGVLINGGPPPTQLIPSLNHPDLK